MTWSPTAHTKGPEKCTLDGCDSPFWARGLCNKHYGQHRKAGTLPPRIRKAGPCEVEGCKTPGYSRGRCRSHYDAARKSGEFTAKCTVPSCPLGAVSIGYCSPHGNRARRYGLTAEDLAALDAATGCDICGAPPVHVDHDHASGHVRGFLCMSCNTALGHFRDDPALLANAIHYLQKAKK